MNNLGIHVFEQIDDLEWESELVGFNLLSALSWKKFHGPVHLYCNTTYLNTLKKWGVDVVYDSINTEIIDNKPTELDYKEFWAYSKFVVLESLIGSTEPFTLIDTDLWLLDKIDLDKDVDVIMYHKENFDINYWNNIYFDFDQFIPQHIKSLELDKTILPTNGALLHIKNPKFLLEWLQLSKDVVDFNYINKIQLNNNSTKMCFIEQRLLPMLLQKQGFKYETFIKQVYQSQLVELQDGSEWLPRIENSSDIELTNFQKIKHVWGMKRYFKYPEIRNLVLDSTITCLSQYDIYDKPYKHLYSKLVSDFLSPQPSSSFA